MKRRKKISTFDIINLTIVGLICLMCILPFYLLTISAFTDNSLLQMKGYMLFPNKLTIDGFKYLFTSSEISFIRSIINSLFVSIAGTIITVFVTLITAYALSKKYLVGVKGISAFLLVTMFFAGGTIPLFLVIKKIGLYDSIWSLIIPSVYNLYFIILLKNYFCSLPKSLEEAAMLDGANDFQILFKVFLPMAIPMILTIAFFTFVAKWNSWLDSLLYLAPKSTDKWTLQFLLKNMLENMEIIGASTLGGITPTLTAKSAAVLIAIAPLLIIFPIIQKFFVNGIVSGASKE